MSNEGGARLAAPCFRPGGYVVVCVVVVCSVVLWLFLSVLVSFVVLLFGWGVVACFVAVSCFVVVVSYVSCFCFILLCFQICFLSNGPVLGAALAEGAFIVLPGGLLFTGGDIWQKCCCCCKRLRRLDLSI